MRVLKLRCSADGSWQDSRSRNAQYDIQHHALTRSDCLFSQRLVGCSKVGRPLECHAKQLCVSGFVLILAQSLTMRGRWPRWPWICPIPVLLSLSWPETFSPRTLSENPSICLLGSGPTEDGISYPHLELIRLCSRQYPWGGSSNLSSPHHLGQSIL